MCWRKLYLRWNSFNPLVHICGRVIGKAWDDISSLSLFQSPCAYMRSGHVVLYKIIVKISIVSIPLCIYAVGSFNMAVTERVAKKLQIGFNPLVHICGRVIKSKREVFCDERYKRFQSPCAYMRSGHKMAKITNMREYIREVFQSPCAYMRSGHDEIKTRLLSLKEEFQSPCAYMRSGHKLR